MTGILLVTKVKGKTKFFVPQADHLRINQVNGYIVTRKYLLILNRWQQFPKYGQRTTGKP